MSSTYAEPLDRLERGLDELAAIGPEFRSTGERQEFLLRVARVKARVVAEELRVLAASDDVAEETGDRSTAIWLATQTSDAHGTVRRHAALAASLGSRWTQTADALGAGDVNLAQARVIVESLEALPDDLGDDLVVKAEAYLVDRPGVRATGAAPPRPRRPRAPRARDRRRGGVPATAGRGEACAGRDAAVVPASR